MAEFKNPFEGVRIKFRSSTPLLKMVVIVLVVFSMAALIALGWVRGGIRQETEDMRREAAALEQENSELEEKVGQLGSVQSVEDIAQDELELADPNTIVFEKND